MFKINLIAATLAGLAATATVSTTAYARDIRVSYADLNLANAEGRATLERRTDAAARQVCEYDNFATGSLMRDSEAVSCYIAARKQAREHVALAASMAPAKTMATRLAVQP